MRVGRAHGLDGSFYCIGGRSPFLHAGAAVTVAGRTFEVAARKGTDAKPIVKLVGIDDRDAAEALHGEEIRPMDEEPPGDDEWLVEDLVGCRIEGVGEVTAVLEGISCDVLEAGGELIPLVTDAVTRVDVENKVIEVDRGFLGL